MLAGSMLNTSKIVVKSVIHKQRLQKLTLNIRVLIYQFSLKPSQNNIRNLALHNVCEQFIANIQYLK